MLPSSPGRAPPIATVPRAEGRLPPRPSPSRLLRRVSAPARPRARRAQWIPGRGRTGSRCSAQRRLHPRVWSQARPGPAGGGGGSGGGILRLPRPPLRPPSSHLLHRLRAPLTGPTSWPGGASPGRLRRRRAFSGAEHRTRVPRAPGQGPGPTAPQPRRRGRAAAAGAGVSPSACPPALSPEPRAAVVAATAPMERRALRSRLHPTKAARPSAAARPLLFPTPPARALRSPRLPIPNLSSRSGCLQIVLYICESVFD